MKGEANVATPCPAYRRMKPALDLAQALLDGTEAMREAGVKYLPREDGESLEGYTRRLRRSFLHPGYSKTINTIASKPFSKPVSVRGELPEPLHLIEENADRQGGSLTTVAKDLFRDAWAFGKAHVLVDMPAVGDNQLRLDQERELGIYPYVSVLHPASVTSWSSWTGEGGVKRLTRVNIRETAEVQSGAWSISEVQQYRVLRWDPEMPDFHTVELWRHDPEKDEWFLYQEPIEATYPGIPLLTYYTNQTGHLEAMPPLRALADLNVAHWQSSSDQRASLRFARVAPMAGFGMDPKSIHKNDIGWGQFWIIDAKPGEADIKFVEHSGVALQAGERDLQDIENKMEILGLQPLVERTANSTATGKAIDASNAASDAQEAVERFEQFWRMVYETCALWAGTEITDDGFDIDIFNEFGISLRAAEDMPTILQLNSSGMLSAETVLNEAKRRGIISEGIDIEEEIEKAMEDSVRRLDMFPGLRMANEAAAEQTGQGGEEDDEEGTEDEEAEEAAPPFGSR